MEKTLLVSGFNVKSAYIEHNIAQITPRFGIHINIPTANQQALSDVEAFIITSQFRVFATYLGSSINSRPLERGLSGLIRWLLQVESKTSSSMGPDF